MVQEHLHVILLGIVSRMLYILNVINYFCESISLLPLFVRATGKNVSYVKEQLRKRR